MAELDWDAVGRTAPGWGSAQDEELICRRVRDETHDVKTFVLAPREPRLFRYLPGQFITLQLLIDGEEINRCYTVSVPPTRPDLLAITVKRHPGGPVSNWLHDHLRPGATLRVVGPAGEFSCFARPPASKYLFLSAGSGITPLMSMSRTVVDLGLDADVRFVHSARSPRDIIFRRELAAMTVHSDFRTAFVCEERGEETNWAGYLGRIDAAMLSLLAPDLLERRVYTCGPRPYMASVRKLIAAAGHDPAWYFEESFSFEDLVAPPAAAPEPAAEPDLASFTVRLERTKRELRCNADQTVLQAGRAAGVVMPSSCTKGICGTCKSRLLSGTVDMKHAGGIRPREIAQGLFLPCCSKPTSNLVIDR